MIPWLDTLRELNILGVAVRLCMAALLGGLLGLERIRKRRPADLRTYMLVCMGAALTLLLGQYNVAMMRGLWSDLEAASRSTTDVTRFSAQVISGIGFLGAGTVIVTGKQEVKGLTTAAGLWACTCMGIAIGAGFYECVALAFLIIFICNRFLPRWENHMIEHARNMNIYVEYESVENLKSIVSCIKGMDTHIYDMDIYHGDRSESVNSHATLYLRLSRHTSRTKLILALSELACVRLIDEL